MTWGTVSCGPVDLYTWQSLSPYNYITNFGGQFQYNVIPPNFNIMQAYNMKNISSSLYAYNQNGGYSLGMDLNNPYYNYQQSNYNNLAYTNGYNNGVNIGHDVLNRYDIDSMSSDIAGLKEKLTTAIESKKINEEQKNKLISLKNRVEAYEEKLKEICEERQNRNMEPKKLGEKISKLKKEFKSFKEQIKSETQAIYETINAGSSSDPESVENGKKDGDAGKVVETPEAKAVVAMTDAELVREICNSFCDAIDGLGTDEDKLELAIASINKDNVIEVMQYWDKTYKQEFNESFIESFMWDAGHDQKQKLGLMILDALHERALESGVDIEADFIKVRRELNSWWINNNTCIAKFNEMFKKIVEAESSATKNTAAE